MLCVALKLFEPVVAKIEITFNKLELICCWLEEICCWLEETCCIEELFSVILVEADPEYVL
jgi:hypothetical protein